MSQFLFRLSKLSSRKHGLIQRKTPRLFSSSATSPYLTLGITVKKEFLDGIKIGDVLLFNPAKEEMLTVPNKTIPKELADSSQIGSSHGWGLYRGEFDRSLCLSDLYNPLAIKSNPTTIPLPGMAYNDNNVVWNVAMSSSPFNQDCVVAIKFLGKQLSLCRPHLDIRWTNLATPFNCLENSTLMYSRRDQRFYAPAPGCNYLCSWDLDFKNDKDTPKFHKLMFRNLPELPQSEWKLLESCCKKETLVESASSNGERFLIKWYSQGFFSPHDEVIEYATRRFMVFREEETTEEGRNMCYTEDIGDLCIFLSRSHPFCITASSCPGLKPNSIYFIGGGLGIYDLNTKTIHHFQPPEGAPSSLEDPYWLPPFSMI